MHSKMMPSTSTFAAASASSAASSAAATPALLRPRALAPGSRSASVASALYRGGKGLSRAAGSSSAPSMLLHRRRMGAAAVVVAALADRPPPPSSTSSSPSSAVVAFNLPLGSDAPPGCRLSVKVFPGGEGGKEEISSVEVTLAGLPSGRALLHWGVVSSDGKQSWKLPSELSRPKGTLNYKNRALQTPLLAGAAAAAGEGETTSSSVSSLLPSQRLTLSFPAAERASALVFVLKDVGTGTWLSPPGGGNFEVPLM